MALPYPVPPAITTRLRCKFSMPGRKYDCRAIGKYLLGDKGYCGRHFDTAWKVANPQFGQQHDWHTHVNRYSQVPDKYESCRRCGDIRVHDGLPQSLCKGKFPEITLRAAKLEVA